MDPRDPHLNMWDTRLRPAFGICICICIGICVCIWICICVCIWNCICVRICIYIVLGLTSCLVLHLDQKLGISAFLLDAICKSSLALKQIVLRPCCTFADNRWTTSFKFMWSRWASAPFYWMLSEHPVLGYCPFKYLVTILCNYSWQSPLKYGQVSLVVKNITVYSWYVVSPVVWNISVFPFPSDVFKCTFYKTFWQLYLTHSCYLVSPLVKNISVLIFLSDVLKCIQMC